MTERQPYPEAPRDEVEGKERGTVPTDEQPGQEVQGGSGGTTGGSASSADSGPPQAGEAAERWEAQRDRDEEHEPDEERDQPLPTTGDRPVRAADQEPPA